MTDAQQDLWLALGVWKLFKFVAGAWIGGTA